MGNSKKRVTLRDVANLAGVSHQTVSRVLSNTGYVAAETKQHINAIINQLGYRPSRIAQVLGGNSSRMLALITYGSWYSEIVPIIDRIRHSARSMAYDVLMADVMSTEQGEMTEVIDRLSRWNIDGIVMFAPLISMRYSELASQVADIPIVLIHNDSADHSIPGVVVDNAGASAQLTRHLIERGHTRICTISGPCSWYAAQERQRGISAALEAAHLTLTGTVEGDWTVAGGYYAAQQLLSAQLDFTAIIAADDNMAIGAIRALIESGRRVPQDVAVVGFDDIPFAAFMNPSLTTARQDLHGIGQLAVQYLAQRIQQPDTPLMHQVIRPEIIIRDSSGGA